MKIRVVADTNIFIAAALKPGGPTDIWMRLAGLPNSSFVLFISDSILAELRKKLLQPKFGFSHDSAINFLAAVRGQATVVSVHERITGIVRDRDDDMIIECAVAAEAHLIVSADKDLLQLGQFRGIGITHPRELKNIFRRDLGVMK